MAYFDTIHGICLGTRSR